MKGVILAIAPDCRLVDICHDIEPQARTHAAFVCRQAIPHFAPTSVHLIVVDPGVGTARRPLAAATDHGTLVLPDNGILGLLTPRLRIRTVHAIENLDLLERGISRTFHGRDLFAPVAARLASGLPLQQVGPRVDDWLRDQWPNAQPIDLGVQGEIIHIDHFGNAISNIDLGAWDLKPPLKVELDGIGVLPLAETYGSVEAGTLIALVGSDGYLEIAVNMGSAAREAGLVRGVGIRVQGS